ncbi:DeoR/GlpR family DNA-binding transcription regulator [Petroclostridium sp. X23]|uniref:DeoR/GlpR family DNA-binding transcription regulator n=1 Tax=Petroclostridium sp. X23 TaxID=3045146 RepID=UPI0024AE7F9D|nr:DeoR/GlpR family DNA-binding transcription regulator [Petroclostridium sp. X23]WHH59011.1 DeoR/GlpR family DNA-binding transcription regulator [Petroclostridium sp. X23]
MNIDRRNKLNSYIQQRGEVQFRELQELFPDVSSMTIRRDLAYLEKNGDIIRIHGGAKSINILQETAEEYSLRSTENVRAKEIIAQKAVKYIETGRSIFLDAGTTIMSLAKILPDERLYIFTTGPNIALEIIKKNSPSVNIIGGHLTRSNISISGMGSLEFIKHINIDIAFMGTLGFSLEAGFTSGSFNECNLKQAIIQKAQKVIMIMDKSKINKNMPYTFATLKDIDILISDEKLPDQILQAANSNNVQVY